MFVRAFVNIAFIDVRIGDSGYLRSGVFANEIVSFPLQAEQS